MSNAISLDGIAKRFRVPVDRSNTLKYRVVHWRSSSRVHDFYALRDVTFDVPWGQFLGIIGHNGSGKSTLLKILSRIYRPTSGTAEINGHISPFLELGVGFNPELTARENVYLNGAVLGLTRADLSGRVDEIIEFAGVQHFADQKLKNFSSGMQVRLAFSVAIRANAGILLMDEVLAVGDAAFQQRCFEIFESYKREGRTVVLVTHDLASVGRYCDRVVLIDHGRVIGDGAPADVTAQYQQLVSQRMLAGRGAVAAVDDEPAPAAPATADAAARSGSAGASTAAAPDGRASVPAASAPAVAVAPPLVRAADVVGVSVLDDADRSMRTVAAGAPLRLRLEYVVREPVHNLGCVLTLTAEDGREIAVLSTREAGFGVRQPPVGAYGALVYDCDRLPLRSGSYRISATLRDSMGNVTYDHVAVAETFAVVDESGLGGLVDLGGRWSAE